jgi:hypothetical protein
MDDHQITDAMLQYGGSFVQQLWRLFRLADDDNRVRLRAAFAEYWTEYAGIARLHTARQAETTGGAPWPELVADELRRKDG